MNRFLPLTPAELALRGWERPDFVCVTADAYVDHPSFGIAVISRLLESLGYRVAILAQPQSEADFTRFGAPRLGFMVTGGNLDSMVCNYTAARRRRSDDPYSPGGKAGARPDRALTVYSRRLRALYPETPIVLGGLEASLRRFAHYDYWDDAVRPSVLEDSGADILVYGMGERQTRAIAARLAAGEPVRTLTDIRGTACWVTSAEIPAGAVSCASFAKVAAEKSAYLSAFKMQMAEQDAVTGRALVQKQRERLLLQNPPALPLSSAELDEVYALPYARAYHPSYEAAGGVKAIDEVLFSLAHNRGCFGHCNFCAITMHQGRRVIPRSHASVLAEAEQFLTDKRFKGYIHDVGGPTANFRFPSCAKQIKEGLCRERKCLGHDPCPQLHVDHSDYLRLLTELRELPGVKKVFVRSGIRYDYLLLDRDKSFLRALVTHHVSGQLKVAPEHVSERVLRAMGKPSVAVFERFSKEFYAASAAAGKEQYLVAYLMSSHPGCTLEDALTLALYLKKHRLRCEQVQDFYPTPGTISTCMFYTGIDPTTGKELYVPRSDREKHQQRALLQAYRPENRALVTEALRALGRTDLIGNGPDCLVPAERGAQKAPDTAKAAAQKHENPKGRFGAAGERAGKTNTRRGAVRRKKD